MKIEKSKLAKIGSGIIDAAILGAVAYFVIDGIPQRFMKNYDRENPTGIYRCAMEDNDYGINPTTADVSCKLVEMKSKNSLGQEVIRYVTPKKPVKNIATI